MKRKYSAPELEIVRYQLSDILYTSPTEDLTEQYGNGDSGGEIDLDDLG